MADNVFISTVPKSGTYLVSKLLEVAGFKRSGYHFLNRGGISYYPPGVDLDEARRNPSKHQCREPVDQVLARVKAIPNSYAVGHIPYSWLPQLEGFKVIHTYRDLRSCLVSRARNLVQTGRVMSRVWNSDTAEPLLFQMMNNGSLGGFAEVLVSVSEWAARKFEPRVRFEDLIDPEKQKEALTAFQSLGKYISLEDFRLSVVGTETLTHIPGNKPVEWESVWSDRVQEIYAQWGLAEANKRMGYDG